MVKGNFQYFKGSLLVTALGLILATGVGFWFSGTWLGGIKALWLCAILAILEVSLSFDNAVINASVLKRMTPIWRHRFLTWGILIAVFGMRLVFPLAVVSILANMSPWSALMLAIYEPDRYAEVMVSAHVSLAGFGGAFLLMVCLKYFFDINKDVHWIHVVEAPLVKLGKMEAVEVGLALLSLYLLHRMMPPEQAQSFLISGIFGLLTFILVDGISGFLEMSDDQIRSMEKASAGLFLYLEVLDTSFSFDGVIGAFALTNNLFLIAIGLGIGAMFVRSLTIYLVEKGTLTQFRYLEHGAFYAIGALAAIMLLDAFMHIPEAVTGLIGAVFIGLSLFSSLRVRDKL